MDNTIQYKGYAGSVEFYEEDGIFYGKVMGICSLISYKGKAPKNFLTIFMSIPLVIQHMFNPQGFFFPLIQNQNFYKVQINLRYGIFLHSDVSR